LVDGWRVFGVPSEAAPDRREGHSDLIASDPAPAAPAALAMYAKVLAARSLPVAAHSLVVSLAADLGFSRVSIAAGPACLPAPASTPRTRTGTCRNACSVQWTSRSSRG
jgi:hypothetical protein